MKLKYFFLIVITICFISQHQAYAQCLNTIVGDTVYVTTDNNTGGSLRTAIDCVNNNPSLRFIHFDFDEPGVITIAPSLATPLPIITRDDVVIDARTNPGWFLGKIVIDGSVFSSTTHCLNIQADNVEVYGLTITGYVNTNTGSAIFLQGSNALLIQNALIGNRYGINTASPFSFTARNNIIGVDPVTDAGNGNAVAGINILTSALGTFEISNNTIANNATGILAASSFVEVLASENSMFCNRTIGIERSGFTVSGFAMNTATPATISGTGPNGAFIEVFIHDNVDCIGFTAPCQGRTFLGSTTVSGGTWTLTPTSGTVQVGDQITATATVGGNNTSEFLSCLTASCPSENVVFSNVQHACENTNSGTATASVPIAGSLTYEWSDGQTNATAINLAPGDYTVIITDIAGCDYIGDITINSSPVPSANPFGTSPICTGETLFLEANVNGGTSPYTYNWNGPDGYMSDEENPSRVISETSEGGTYTLMVTDANGCEDVESAFVDVNAPPDFDLNTRDISCNGAGDGSIDLIPIAIVPPITYEWSNTADTEDIENLSAGIYSVTVTDGNGCTSSDNRLINEPLVLFIDNIQSNSPSMLGGNDGSFSFNVNGGTAPYTYSWTGPVSGNDNQAGPGMAIINNLPAGDYNLTLSDDNGCDLTQAFTIMPFVCSFSIDDSNVIHVSCNGEMDGQIDISLSNGMEPITFSWDNGATSEDISGLSAGTYALTATDASGCTAFFSTTVMEPLPFFINNIQSNSPSMLGGNDGSFSFNINGGTAPYTYSWTGSVNGNGNQANPGNAVINNLPAGDYTLILTDGNGCDLNRPFTILPFNCDFSIDDSNITHISCNGEMDGQIDISLSGGMQPFTFNWNNGATTEDISGLGPGAYDLTVTDASGCPVFFSATIIEPLPFLIDNIQSNSPSMLGGNDGSFSFNINGGTAPYTYSWTGPVNGSANQAGPGNAVINNLPAGDYNLTLSDDNGCDITRPFTITPFNCDFSIDDSNVSHVSCNGEMDGQIDISLSGGMQPITFNWDNGATTEDISGLSAGTYALTATDASGCTAFFSATVMTPPPFFINNIQSNSPSMPGGNDGSFSFNINGGTAPYTYSWTGPVNGNTNQATPGSILINNLPAGNYDLVITDANDCIIERPFTINSINCNLSITNETASDESCAGEMDGSISLTVNNGTPPYNYNWTNGSNSANGSGTEIANLAGAVYDITITDQDNCVVTTSLTVNTNSLSSPSSTTSSNCAEDNGAATFDLSDLESTITPNPEWSIVWFEDPVGMTPILDPATYSSSGGIIYAATNVGNCFSALTGIELIVLPPDDPACMPGGCITFAGTFSDTETQTVCNNFSAADLYNNDAILDTDDTLVFILHTLGGENLGTILATESTPTATFDADNMTYGTTYYLSAVVGNSHDISGIDLNDPCLSVAAGQAVVFSESLGGVLNFIQGEEVLCQSEDLFLSTNVLTGFDLSYYWIQPNGDTIITPTANLLIENIQPLDAGDYYVFVQDESCLFDQTGPFTLTVLGLAPDEQIDAGNDTTICDHQFTLNAAPVSNGNGFWTGPAGVLINAPNTATTSVSALNDGANQFIWTVNTADCGTIGSDTLTITVADGLQAADDSFTLAQANSEIFMDVLKNDGLADQTDFTLQALTQPDFGTLLTLDNGFQYFEPGGQRGVVSFVYEICYTDGNCANSCATATVTIDVLNLPYLPEGFTPNNDGKNDQLQVLGYSGGGDISMKIQITNRWGDIVYSSDNYLLETPWDGRMNDKEQTLIEGTYYAWIEITVDGVVYQQSQALYLVK